LIATLTTFFTLTLSIIYDISFLQNILPMKKLFTSAFVFFIAFSALAQYENIVISTLYSPEEPSISMNPKNTDLLFAGANKLLLFG